MQAKGQKDEQTYVKLHHKKIYYRNEHSHMRGMKGIRAIWVHWVISTAAE